MRLERVIVKVIPLLVLALAAAAPGWATAPVRGASNYGGNPSFNSCDDGSYVLSGIPCEAFDLSTIGTVTLTNGDVFNVVQYVTDQNSTSSPMLFDVVDFGNLTAGTYTIASTTLATGFNVAGLGVFTCGEANSPLSGDTITNGNAGFDGAFDNNNNAEQGPCTAGLTTDPLIALSGNGFTIPTGSSISGLDVVMDTPVLPTTTPEPTSLTLVGVGLAVMGSTFLRRK